MNNLPSPISKNFIKSLFTLFVPETYSEKDTFVLSIKISCKNLSVRQFASYMNFIDKAYGRLSPKGLISYSRSTDDELRIEEIRHGSIEIILSKLLSNIYSVNALILVGLLLKYLPSIIKSTISAYKDFEEGRLARARRDQIKEQIRKDNQLNELNDRQIYQLTQFLDTMYSMDLKNLPKAHYFSKDTVIKIEFKTKTVGEPDKGDMGKLRFKRSLEL